MPSLLTQAFDLLGLARPNPEDTAPARPVRKLAEALRARGASEQHTEEVVHAGWALLALLGVTHEDSPYEKLDPQARFEQIFSGLTALLRSLATSAPTLLIIEDAYALDSDTTSLLARVMRQSANVRLGIIHVYRNDVEEQLPEELLNSEISTEIVLQPLSQAAVRELLTDSLGAPVSDSFVSFVNNRVGTNPLYVKELARFLHDKKLLRQGPNGFQAAAESVSVPRELHTLMVQRLDSLPEQVRTVARTAAVIGSEFDTTTLERIVSNADLNRSLELGTQEGLWRSVDERRYRFTQDLLREAIVEMQFEGELQELHARIAAVMREEYRGDPSRAADIAYHCEQAQDEERTCSYLWTAFGYARDNFKNDKAIEFLERYLRYARNSSERVEAYRQMAAIHEVTGAWDHAADALTYALGMTVISNNAETRGQLLASLGAIYQRRGRIEDAMTALENALRIARERKNPQLAAEALISLGRARWSAGDYTAAQRSLTEAQRQAATAKDLRQEGLALYFEGVVLRDQNRFQEAMENYRRSLEKLKELGDERLITYPLYDMGVVLQYEGKLDTSQQYFEQALNVYEETGYRSGASAALLNLGVLRDRRGDFETALEYFQQAREIAEAIDERLAIAYTLFSIGATYYKLHDYRKAHQYLKDALKIMQHLKAKGYYGFAHSYLVSLCQNRIRGTGGPALLSARQKCPANRQRRGERPGLPGACNRAPTAQTALGGGT